MTTRIGDSGVCLFLERKWAPSPHPHLDVLARLRYALSMPHTNPALPTTPQGAPPTGALSAMSRNVSPMSRSCLSF